MVTRAAMSGTAASLLFADIAPLADTAPIEPMPLPLDSLPTVSWTEALLVHPLVKGLLPFPLLIGLAVPVWWVFRKWWQEMDRESALERARRVSGGEAD